MAGATYYMETIRRQRRFIKILLSILFLAFGCILALLVR